MMTEAPPPTAVSITQIIGDCLEKRGIHGIKRGVTMSLDSCLRRVYQG